MAIDTARARQYLRDFNLKSLFVEELGWERHAATHAVTVDGNSYRLDAVAHKRGLAVFICEPGATGRIPDYATRRKIDRQVAKVAHEHVIVFVDSGKTTQVWQWVKKEPGKPVACREHTFYRSQPGDALIQKLQGLGVTIDEEASLTLPEVTGRVRAAFDVERVTKRFYDRFKSEHEAFSKFLKGIPDDDMQRWYVSVMLNRLMFIYFIQKKGFLSNNPNYLRDKLAESKKRGKDRFYTDFLCPLFFEGFAKKEAERSAATNQLLGKVPYLNGGLFLKHQIEERYGNAIQIGDVAFEKLFAFFEQYHWHLDERPLKRDDEINPDVLGYIFEKYINQKQMGAYYSKEDITGYISQNTVIPFLFDQARKGCKIAFEGEHNIWRLLQVDPDRYIYDPLKKGVTLKLPPEIASGLNDASKRVDWNRPAQEEFRLPTELWREVVARRKHYEEVRSKLAAGQMHSINDLITYNLDIRQFAQDVIETSEGPELLRAFYKAIKTVSVLDPACGSGAYLFAALNILESLYEACLDRMQVFLDELEQSKEKHRPEKFADFKKELELVTAHPNRKYFVHKTIIVNNLFGVDIMEEATEICKLRLFLKLVAQIDRTDQIEPLPDIDFNIRAGNSLVGYASYEDVRHAVTSKLDFERTMDLIEEKAQEIERLFVRFREQQTTFGGEITLADKEELRRRLKSLEDELNRYLAGEYGIKISDRKASKTWQANYKPFHWFIEFYGIMKRGGFDAVIGKPPYIEYKEVRDQYRLLPAFDSYATNLFAAFAFRTQSLKQAKGPTSFIVPVSLPSTDRMKPVRDLLNTGHRLYYTSFSTRPSKLFEGAEQRLTIHAQIPSDTNELFSGGYLKWNAEERESLFSLIQYVSVQPLSNRHNIWPKLHGCIELDIWNRMQAFRTVKESGMLGSGAVLYYKNTGIRYFNTVTLRPPKCTINGVATSSSRETTLAVLPRFRNALHSFLLSTTFFVYHQFTSNCRDLNPADILLAPVPDLSGVQPRLNELSLACERDYTAKAKIVRMRNKLTGLVELESLTPARSKPILDQIDQTLAGVYCFTPVEVDHVVNYDIKYRMGDELEEAED